MAKIVLTLGWRSRHEHVRRPTTREETATGRADRERANGRLVTAAPRGHPTSGRSIPVEGVAAALRAATSHHHAEAETATFVTDLLAAQLDLSADVRW